MRRRLDRLERRVDQFDVWRTNVKDNIDEHYEKERRQNQRRTRSPLPRRPRNSVSPPPLPPPVRSPSRDEYHIVPPVVFRPPSPPPRVPRPRRRSKSRSPRRHTYS
eukprot:11133034-Heterocapsa_arctica.AAC.1